MQVKRFAVFCGSKSGTNPSYESDAMKLGVMMAQNRISLIYGGGNKGIMGTIANAVMHGGGEVIGVIPEILMEWEAGHKGITELIVVQDMHVRKKMMYEMCDAAIILPGGNGTLDELFEMLTWNTLNIHDKKIVLLNSSGFYDHLIAHIHKMEEQGFLYENWRERLLICNDPENIISYLV
jgi:uncharacterized protein (TIGR00730 family)